MEYNKYDGLSSLPRFSLIDGVTPHYYLDKRNDYGLPIKGGRIICCFPFSVLNLYLVLMSFKGVLFLIDYKRLVDVKVSFFFVFNCSQLMLEFVYFRNITVWYECTFYRV